jgi:hypothetical protein
VNANCGLCRQPFKTGESTVMLSGAAVHSPCPTQRGQAAVPLAEVKQAHPVIAYERPSKLNKTEAAYFEHLKARQRIGEFRRVDAHPEHLRLADSTFYIPDFRVVTVAGVIEFHEVKGFLRDDSWAKLKIAVEMHPYRFLIVRLAKGSSLKAPRWTVDEVGERAPR